MQVMKKNIVYSFRMSPQVREALRRAARKERRTMASLLDKIILDYLEVERFLLPFELGSERRKHPHKKVTLPAVTALETETRTERLACVVLDIAMDGVLVSYPKGSRIQTSTLESLARFFLSFKLPDTGEELRFACDPRRMVEKDGDLQVGAIFTDPDKEALSKLRVYLQ